MFEAPQLINIVIGGKTPTLPQSRLAELGFGITLYANAQLQSAVRGMQRAMNVLMTNGRLDEDPDLVVPFSERQRLVNKPFYDGLDEKYAAHDD
jgi:2-methylisocitrate lyase-like PEP mutase family enzyme